MISSLRGRDAVSDAIDLTMVTQSALPGAFTFLFGQVDSLLTRWRERRDAHAELTAEQVPRELVGTLSLPGAEAVAITQLVRDFIADLKPDAKQFIAERLCTVLVEFGGTLQAKQILAQIQSEE